MHSHFKMVGSLMVAALLASGCGDESADSKPAAGGSTAVASPASSAGYAVGKVTKADGSPLTGEIKDIGIAISGVSEAAEKVYYTPAVKNGVFKQKLAPGQYRFERGTIDLAFKKFVFKLPLVPVGSNWSKNQDAADGIEQDFIWKMTGQAETYGAAPDPNNATHWYGMSVGMRFSIYREDKKAAAVAPPKGSKLIFTFTPRSKAIDGSEVTPIVREQEWDPTKTFPDTDINDLPPADYDLTGEIKLPDGTSKPMLFQGRGNYPNYVAKADVPLETDGLIGGMWKQLMVWGVD